MSWKVPQTSNIQVETIRLINGLISCWKCLKYGHWGRNLSSIVSRLCNTLSSEKIFGSCWALTTVSFSRQRSSMLCSGFSFAKTIYLQNNDDMREGRNKLEENTFIANISETAAVASTVLPLYANFFPLSLPPSFSSYPISLSVFLSMLWLYNYRPIGRLVFSPAEKISIDLPRRHSWPSLRQTLVKMPSIITWALQQK